MITIPAIDLLEGRVVRLVHGDPVRARAYSADPVGVARRFEDAGARWLHVVDLDAALGRGSNTDTVSAICRAVEIPVQVGGGLRDSAAVAQALRSGAERVVLGTLASDDPVLFGRLAGRYGERLVVALDLRGGRVSLDGWRRDGNPLHRVLPELVAGGAVRFLVTSVAADGTLAGPDVALYRGLREMTERPLIASGGVGGPDDLRDLAATGVEATVVGTAVYEGRIDLGAVAEVTP